jgi:hypothetical protein
MKEAVDIDVLRRLIEAAAPERKAEFADLLAEIDPKLFVVEDTVDICLQVTEPDGDIEYSSKTMRLFWLLGFVAWRIFAAYSPAVLWGTMSRQRLGELMRQDEGLQQAEFDFKLLLGAAQNLQGIAPDRDYTWPEGIPEPQKDKCNIPDKQHQATFDLVSIATAYAFLHELRHIWNLRQPSRPANRAEEEIDCDVFARSFLMDKVGAHAQRSGDAYEKLVNKRAMGIALGIWIVYEITPEYGRAGSRTHPAMSARIEALTSNMPARPDADFWVWLSTLLLAALRQHNRSADPIFDDPESVAMQLLEGVRQIA